MRNQWRNDSDIVNRSREALNNERRQVRVARRMIAASASAIQSADDDIAKSLQMIEAAGTYPFD